MRHPSVFFSAHRTNSRQCNFEKRIASSISFRVTLQCGRIKHPTESAAVREMRQIAQVNRFEENPLEVIEILGRSNHTARGDNKNVLKWFTDGRHKYVTHEPRVV